MMRPVLLAALCALAPGCATVPPPPVCAQPEVLLLVAERLERAGLGQVIEPGSVSQVPGEAPDLVRCAARVFTATYDTNRFGAAPAIVVGIVQYAVLLRTNGAFLLPEAPGTLPPVRPGQVLR